MALTEEQYKEYYPKTYEKAMAEEWGGKVQASPSHKTDIFDLAKAGKTYDSSKHGSFQEYWEQYKQEHGLSKYRESALSTGRAYYEVPVTASTGEAAKMGMTQAVYERYQEALREQQMAQMPSVMQYQFGAPDIPYGTATTEQIAAAEAKFIEKAKLGQITADEMAWFEAQGKQAGAKGPVWSGFRAEVSPMFAPFLSEKARTAQFEYMAKYPVETAAELGRGAVMWPLVAGAGVVEEMRAGKPLVAFGRLLAVGGELLVAGKVAKIGKGIIGKTPLGERIKFNSLVKQWEATHGKTMPANTKASFKAMWDMTKTWKGLEPPVKTVPFEKVKGVTPTEAAALRKYFSEIRKNDIIGGSAAQDSQIYVKGRKLGDIDAYTIGNPQGRAAEVFKVLNDISPGKYRLKGHKVENVKLGKVFEAHPISMLRQLPMEGIFKGSTTRSPESIRVLKISEQGQRKVVGAVLGERAKDFTDFKRIAKSLYKTAELKGKLPSVKAIGEKEPVGLIDMSAFKISGFKAPKTKPLIDMSMMRPYKPYKPAKYRPAPLVDMSMMKPYKPYKTTKYKPAVYKPKPYRPYKPMPIVDMSPLYKPKRRKRPEPYKPYRPKPGIPVLFTPYTPEPYKPYRPRGRRPPPPPPPDDRRRRRIKPVVIMDPMKWPTEKAKKKKLVLFKPLKSKRKYAPSLLGLYLGKTARKQPKRITGFGVRPVVKRKKRKKR